MNKERLKQIADKLVAKGKGILAADESNGTMGKRLESIGKENTEENRRAWRELLFTTPGWTETISGVIMFEETLGQSTKDGCPFVDLMEDEGVVPGIKVDKGLVAFNGSEIEKVTDGLAGLEERLDSYYKQGARFAKWRALFHISNDTPSKECVTENAKRLAAYAFACQEAGLVPIVEPEVFMEGSHTFERCKEVMNMTFEILFNELAAAGVYNEGMLLKPSMITAGTTCETQASPEQVAKETVECLKTYVPKDVAGVVFLSGGQTASEASLHLDLMNKLGSTPWPLSYSYGRALQAEALKTWGGEAANKLRAQTVFYNRAKCCSAASTGTYTNKLESLVA